LTIVLGIKKIKIDEANFSFSFRRIGKRGINQEIGLSGTVFKFRSDIFLFFNNKIFQFLPTYGSWKINAYKNNAQAQGWSVMYTRCPIPLVYHQIFDFQTTKLRVFRIAD
jgi:hypothetical protein